MIDHLGDLGGGWENGSPARGRVHEDLRVAVELDIPQRGEDGHIVERTETGHLLELGDFHHGFLRRRVVLLEINEWNVFLSALPDQLRDFVDRVVQMMGGEGNADVRRGVEFAEVADRIGRRQHRVLVILDRHGDAQFLGQLVVGFQLLEEGFHLPLRLLADRIAWPHGAGSADRHLTSEGFDPTQFLVLPERSQRITGRDAHPGAAVLEQYAAGIVPHLLDLLAMGGVCFSPDIDPDAAGFSDFGEDAGEE